MFWADAGMGACIPTARITAVNANALEQYLVIAEAHAYYSPLSRAERKLVSSEKSHLCVLLVKSGI